MDLQIVKNFFHKHHIDTVLSSLNVFNSFSFGIYLPVGNQPGANTGKFVFVIMRNVLVLF